MHKRNFLAKPLILLWFLLISGPVFADVPQAKPRAKTGSLARYVKHTKGTGKLKTSIITYQNNAGQQLDLISAVHVGTGSYYTTLNQKFTNYDAVLYELILPDEMVGQQLPAQMETGSGVSGMQGMMARSLGLTTQIKKIDYSASNFVHADLTQSGLSQEMTERQENLMGYLMKALASSASTTEADLGISEEELAQVDMMAVLSGQTTAKDRTILRKIFASALSSSGGLLSALNDTALIGARNEAALKVLKQQSQAGKRKMALFYGAAHMPDFEKRLRKAGWKRGKATWVDAW